MEKESLNSNKELLLKDLCSRLLYGVKGVNMAGLVSSPSDWYCAFGILGVIENRLGYSEWKPYLFPLSSMTEEQKMELNMLKTYVSLNKNKEYLLFDWFNANHFDWRGLIPMDLAIDCTDLNIY